MHTPPHMTCNTFHRELYGFRDSQELLYIPSSISTGGGILLSYTRSIVVSQVYLHGDIPATT